MNTSEDAYNLPITPNNSFIIFIIEDDKGLNRLISNTLKKNGFEVKSAHSGKEALSLLKGEPSELILLDYKLSDITGNELVEKYKTQFGRNPHFMAMTGYGNVQIELEMLNLGAKGYIKKETGFVDILPVKLKYICAEITKNRNLEETKKNLEKHKHFLTETGRMARVGGWEFDLETEKICWTDVKKEIHEVPQDYIPKLNNAFDFFPDEAKKKLRKAFTNTCKTGEPYDLELPFITAKGKKGWIHVMGKATIEDNKVRRVYGVFQDISFRKKAETELRKSKEKAEEADQLKTAFLLNVSHEVRTPMNGILGFASLLRESKLRDEDRQSYIDIIEKSSNRLLNTINDLVNISKIDTDQVELMDEEIAVKKEIENLHYYFAAQAAEKNLELILEPLNIGELDKIKTDSKKFSFIISSLIDNAIKFTQKGEIIIGCSKSNDKLKFFVKDTGIGIPKNMHDKIFKRFVQVERGYTRNYEGSGLGLPISKAYVQMLGGEIWLESEKDKGSTFYFTVPVERAAKKEVALMEPFSHSKIELRKKPKILIAEDDKTSELHLTHILKNWSREILTAQSGLQAVEICKSNPDIDLILMDIRMPGMDGYNAARKIRKINKNIIIIAQTAFAMAGDREKAMQTEFNDYISKPISETKLWNVIEKTALNRYS
jgi:signal transduction histidine kinase/DNA-binding response OmpR family regulator